MHFAAVLHEVHGALRLFLDVCELSRLSCVRLFATPWTVACQAPLSVGFSRQEHWNGLLCPPPGVLPDPGMEPSSRVCPALAGGSSPRSLREAQAGSRSTAAGTSQHLRGKRFRCSEGATLEKREILHIC